MKEAEGREDAKESRWGEVVVQLEQAERKADRVGVENVGEEWWLAEAKRQGKRR
jgi:hypothetical protein